MAVSLRIEHLRDPGILHTLFDKPARVESLEDVRHIRNRMRHALLEWTDEPIWVVSLENMTIETQWQAAFEELFRQLRREGVADILFYRSGANDGRMAGISINEPEGRDCFPSPLYSSKEEAFDSAASIRTGLIDK